MADLIVYDTTVSMLPPANTIYTRYVFGKRSYDSIPGVAVQVLALDAPVLQMWGWALVIQNVQLQILTLGSSNFAVAAPQGTLVGTILGATPGSTITLDALSVAGALQIVGTNLQVGSTPTASAGTVTFNLIESLPGASNSPKQTNGFSVSAVAVVPPPVNTVIPAITGTAQEGQTLTASTGTWLNNPTAFTYQWNRNNVPISGSIFSTYLIGAADVGAVLTVSVFATNSAGTSAAATSLPTPTVIAAPAPAPVPKNGTITRYVRMHATQLGPSAGYSLWEMEVFAPTAQATNIALNKPGTSSSNFDATFLPAKAFDGDTTTTRWASAFDGTAIQWIYVSLGSQDVINQVKIFWHASAYAVSYKVQVSDDAVAWTDIFSTTAGAGGVADISQRPTISGSAVVGQTLTAANGIWTNTPTSYAYQWFRGMTAISGANASSYVITSSDAGNQISVSVIASNAGGPSLPSMSAPTATVAAIVSPPSGLPTIFALGLRSDMVNGWWMPESGVQWNYRYQYLNWGWETWNSPSGAIVTLYSQFSIDNGYIPVFDWYLAGSLNITPASLFAHLADPAKMNTYFTSFKLMLQKAGAFTSTPIIVHVEPDMWSFMQQQLSSNPTTVTVSVASSGFSEVGSYANTASGFAQALLALRNTYAPNVKLAWDNALWATNYEPTTTASPTAAGTSVASFYNLLAATFDLIFFNSSDRDSGYKVAILGQPTSLAWWTDTAFSNFRQYISTILQATGRTGMLWQTPVGNTLYRSCNNTIGHYQDNRPEYFLKAGNRQRIVDYAGAGIIGVLFGEGQTDQCTYWDARGDGITNPAVIAGGSNSLIASYADDDGGFLRTAAAAYYQSPVLLPLVPPPAVPVNTAIPTISGTAQVGQTLTATTGSWTNSPTSYAYQWKRAGASISGATASTYVPVAVDVGFPLTVSVTATNAAGSSVAATSNATATVISASSLVFPASTANYNLIAQETLALPAYLAEIPGTSTALGNRLRRISDDTTFGGHQTIALPLRINRHRYSKEQPWNADESRVFLSLSKYPGALLNGSTYAYLGTVPGFVDGIRHWSNTNPDLLYGVQSSPAALKSYNISTLVTATIATFPQYSNLQFGNGEGNTSDDDRYIALMGVSGTSLVVFCYDLVSNAVVGSRTFANTTISNNIDFATMSPSGNYVAILMENTNLGYPAGSLQLFDRQMNYIRQLHTSASHVDFGYDSSGNEVVVGKGTTTGDIFNLYLYTVPLATGIERRETAPGSINNLIHISCRNVRRPGWAYISDYAGTDPTHPITYYNPYFNYNEIFALKLDGTGTIERWAKEHHVTDPSFNFDTNNGYYRGVMACPSRNGDRVLFASDWGDVATDAFVETYIAWYA